MTALYYDIQGKIHFTLIPKGMEKDIPVHRASLNGSLACRGGVRAAGFDFPAVRPESMIQFKVMGDAYWDNFSAGATLRNAESVNRLKQQSVTTFADDRGLELKHILTHTPGGPYIEVNTKIVNHSGAPVTLEMLSSFSLGLLSPFQPDDGSGKYRIHRWLSNWSSEGRHENRSVEELNLEMSWQGYGIRSLRFGEQGSMPVRGYFPQVAFEDTAKGVVWGAALAVTGSWQLEVSRSSDFFNISGGLVDREFGQWTKVLQPGEIFRGPAAVLSCVRGNVADLLPRLTAYQEADLPESEQDLPVIFNEWCTTWGRPVPAKLMPIAGKLQNRDIRYFVLDAGWFKSDGDGLAGVGDWNIGDGNYPEGLDRFAAQLREMGFIPGIWFEFEVATDDSKFYATHPELLLHQDGKVLRSGPRSFLDFRKPEVIEYLNTKLIRMLKENHFGYLKVDYNAPTGFGCDGADSQPEELRKHLAEVEKFFLRLKSELPELVIEICSSGGHRLSPAWMRLASMGSFSDAHEGVEIPLVAANTAQLIPMRKNQIWAVLHPDDDDNRLYYSLAAGMLGRLCLSGNIAELNENQLKTMSAAIAFYRQAAPLIRCGKTQVTRRTGESYTHPTGYQVFSRSNDTHELLVIHTFGNTPDTIDIPVTAQNILRIFAPSSVSVELQANNLKISVLSHFNGLAVYLTK